MRRWLIQRRYLTHHAIIRQWTYQVFYNAWRAPQMSFCQAVNSRMICILWQICNEIVLTHRGRVTHICVGKLTIIGWHNGLSPERRQAIIWTNAGIVLIGPLGTNFSEILIEIQIFSLKKIRLKMSSAKCCSFRLGHSVLKIIWRLCVTNVNTSSNS